MRVELAETCPFVLWWNLLFMTLIRCTLFVIWEIRSLLSFAQMFAFSEKCKRSAIHFHAFVSNGIIEQSKAVSRVCSHRYVALQDKLLMEWKKHRMELRIFRDYAHLLEARQLFDQDNQQCAV